MEKETVICPGCNSELDVGGLYGIGLECSECGQRIDVFSDNSVVIYTEFGKMAIEELKFPKESLLRVALAALRK